MTYLQLGGLFNVVIIAIVAVAIVVAILYRLGYFGGGRRGRSNHSQGDTEETPQQPSSQSLTSLQPRAPPPPPPITEERPVRQAGRTLLVESKPLEVKPVQRQEATVSIERIEKLISGIENELIQVIKQSSADTADLLLAKIGELRNYIEQLMRQCTAQYPPFTQMGYVPSSLSEFRELFRASFVGLLRNGEMLEYTGEPMVSDELLKSLLSYSTDFLAIYHEDKYLYLVRYGDYSLVLTTEDYLDPVSSGLVRMLFRKFIDEVLKQQG